MLMYQGNAGLSLKVSVHLFFFLFGFRPVVFRFPILNKSSTNMLSIQNMISDTETMQLWDAAFSPFVM